MWPPRYKYDAFISHAVEDKLAIANDLCLRLEKAGLKIWYSGKELMPGDSLEKTIKKGLSQSRYGIVILSRKYLEKNWTMKEFYMLLAKEIEHRKVIIPVLYDITVDDLRDRDIAMIDRWAIPFSKGLDYVVESIIKVIKNDGKRRITEWKWFENNSYAPKFWLFLALIGLFCIFLFTTFNDGPSATTIRSAITTRIKHWQREIDNRPAVLFNSEIPSPVSSTEMEDVFDNFMNLRANFRNEYEFNSSIQKVRAKKNVEKILNINAEGISPTSGYPIKHPQIHFKTGKNGDRMRTATYTLLNTLPLRFEIVDENEIDNGIYEVHVKYDENIRLIVINLTFPDSTQTIKRKQVSIWGFLPIEKYIFERKGNDWVLKSIE